MLLKTIILNNFRNFKNVNFTINSVLTIILGLNAKGKTNLLEAIYFIINGTGFRENKEEELINITKEDASVNGLLIKSNINLKFDIHLTKNGNKVSKLFYINNSKQKYYQYIREQVKAILFAPEQIDIIIGSPEIRRNYINRFISGYDFNYKKTLVNFENALRQRNKILENYRNEKTLRNELDFWNQYMTNQASYITKQRQQYINYLNNHPKLDSKLFYIEYLKNEINLNKLEQVFEQEKRWRKTLIGPQKDDFQIYLKNKDDKNIHHYGSRSEQRLAILWLKINEILYYEELTKQKPIILLDDVFSEFDSANKKLILNLIKKYQTIITTTDASIMEFIKGEKTIINLT